MNVTFKELLEQAKNEVNALFVWTPNGPEREDVIKKRFAELIILECSSICYKNFDNGDEIATFLMNAFGVEE